MTSVSVCLGVSKTRLGQSLLISSGEGRFMDRRMAFWTSALWATKVLQIMPLYADLMAALKSQKAFGIEIAYCRQYDKALAYRNN